MNDKYNKIMNIITNNILKESSMNNLTCDCEDYKIAMEWILFCKTIAVVYEHKYEYKSFKYCPWCGKKLKGYLTE